MKILVVATSEKIMSIYSAEKLHNLVNFSLDIGGFNCMKYFESYQVLLVSGYENVVKVFTFTPGFNEINIVGRLVGHVGIIEGIEVLQDTAMVLTADDKGVAKLWDIRKLACIQTLRLENKANINCVLHLPNHNRVVFVGDRLNSLEFEEDRNLNKLSEKIQPLAFDVVEDKAQLYLATKSEVRLIDLLTGQVKAIFVNMIEKEQSDEITCFKLIQKKNIFVLGNLHGVVNFFNANTSELLIRSQPHTASITGIQVDDKNEMILSTAIDSTMRLQVERQYIPQIIADEVDDAEEREEFFSKPIMHHGNALMISHRYTYEDLKEKEEEATRIARSRLKHEEAKITVDPTDKMALIRSLDNCNYDTEITLVELSSYHNMIALTNQNGRIFLYNYEHFKPGAVIDLENEGEVTSLSWLTGFSKLVASLSSGKIFFFSILIENLNTFKVSLDFDLNIGSISCTNERGQKFQLKGHVNRAAVDISFEKNQQFNTKTKYELMNLRNLMKIDERILTLASEIYLAETSGTISRFDLSEYLENQPIFQPFSVNPNYNAFRKAEENFLKNTITLDACTVFISQMKPNFNPTMFSGFHIKTFIAAREALSQLTLTNFNQKLLMACSLDSTFRVFTVDGRMLCHLNLNHPLPILWNLAPQHLVNFKKKLAFALKTIELMNQRYCDPSHRHLISLKKIAEICAAYEFNTFHMTSIDQEATPSSRRSHILQSFKMLSSAQEISQGPSPRVHDKLVRGSLPDRKKEVLKKQEQFQGAKVATMKDMFHPKDTIYEKIRQENREEIQGPSIKHLERMKRAKNIGNMIDPLYGKEIEVRRSLYVQEEMTKNSAMNLAKLSKADYEDPIEAELRRRRIKNSMSFKMYNKLKDFDDKLIADLSIPIAVDPVITKSGRNFKDSIIKLDLKSKHKNRPAKLRPIETDRPKADLPKLPDLIGLKQLESSLKEEILEPAPDFFEYALQKNLGHEESSLSKDIFRSKILHESSKLTQASVIQSITERRQEKKHFQSIIKDLDKRMIKAKISGLKTKRSSETSKGYQADCESTLLSSRVNVSSRNHVSVSLPRLNK